MTNYLKRFQMSDTGNLREYQVEAKYKTFKAWQDGFKFPMIVMPTGTGKTFTFVDIIKTFNEPTLAIAHRQELVGQISRSLAQYGIRHRIIAPDSAVRKIVSTHIAKFGKSFHDPSGRVAAGSVQTLMSWNGTGVDGDTYYQRLDVGGYIEWFRENGQWSKVGEIPSKYEYALTGKRPPKNIRPDLQRYIQQVGLIVGDEGHHYLANNMWGKACNLFTRAKGLLVTATPIRADKKGLGAHASGLVDKMITVKSTRWAIENGFLSDYRIIAPPNSIDWSTVKTSVTTGDYVPQALADATAHSNLITPSGDDMKNAVIGDVVKHYLKFAKGKLTITFAPSIDICHKLCEQFNSAGVTAAVLTGDTPDDARFKVLQRFERREIMQLINVDLFGEGFDCPAVEAVQMVRRTLSLSLYLQQIGRALRMFEGKEKAIVLDHVGNVERHGLPDLHREWSLDDGEVSGESGGGEVMRTCLADMCYEPYPAYLTQCPHCGSEPLKVCIECENLIPKIADICEFCGTVHNETRTVEWVDGDLVELDDATLEEMRNAVQETLKPLDELVNDYRESLIAKHTPSLYIGRHVRNFSAKQVKRRESLELLLEQMAWYGGYMRHDGLTDSEIHRRFFHQFNIDWLSAQVLDTKEADELSGQIMIDLAVKGI